MKVAIISSCSLAIPAVNGGAVETLIENLVKQNEIHKKLDLTVISVYDKEAETVSKKYRFTNFMYLKKNPIIKKSDLLLTKLIKIVKKDKTISSKNYLWKINVLKKLSKHLLESDYDCIVIENTAYLFNVFKNKKVLAKYEDKYYFHVHNDLTVKNYSETILKCNRYIGISNYINQNIIKNLGSGIKERVSVLYNGIDTELFEQKLKYTEREDILKSLGIPKNKKIIFFAGRITPEKGIKELLLAFEKISSDDIVLLVVGSSYFGNGTLSVFEKEIIDLIDNMPNKVFFTGYIKYKDIWRYYQLSSVAVLPSIWDEPLGLTMIEAKCSGIPIITTNSGGIPETVKEGQGIILERDENLIDNIKNSIIEVINDLEYWKKRGNESKKEALKINSLENFYLNFVDIIIKDYTD